MKTLTLIIASLTVVASAFGQTTSEDLVKLALSRHPKIAAARAAIEAERAGKGELASPFKPMASLNAYAAGSDGSMIFPSTVDPVNYAIDATANHPIHVIEILGDTAVPNRPTDYIAQLWGLPSISTSTPPVPAPPATVEGIVRYKAGAHSSLFNPQPSPAVTAEMQQQTVFYAASGGSQIRINNASVVQ